MGKFTIYFKCDVAGVYLSDADVQDISFKDEQAGWEFKLSAPKSGPQFSTVFSVRKCVSVNNGLSAEITQAYQKTLADDCNNFWDDFSVDLKKWCTETQEQLLRSSDRFLSLYSWFGGHDMRLPIDFDQKLVCFRWRPEGQEAYCIVPLPQIQYIQGKRPNPYERLFEGEVSNLEFGEIWAADFDRLSLPHELIREAIRMQEHSPRSALLLSYSALEVGLKKFISKNFQDTEWLISEMQSPPVPRLIFEHIPKLNNVYEKFFSRMKKKTKNKYMNSLYEFGKERNKLAHAGETLTIDLQERFELVLNFLYLFDCIDGTQWAKRNMTDEFRSAFFPADGETA